MMKRQSHLPKTNVSRRFIPELEEDIHPGDAAEEMQECGDGPEDDDIAQGSLKGGWQRVRAVFDEVDVGFSTDEDGTLYHSTSSGNTCAVANCCFEGNDRAAWEFELLSDSYGDECSVFGAASSGDVMTSPSSGTGGNQPSSPVVSSGFAALGDMLSRLGTQ